jgi:hypothetical protein
MFSFEPAITTFLCNKAAATVLKQSRSDRAETKAHFFENRYGFVARVQ